MRLKRVRWVGLALAVFIPLSALAQGVDSPSPGGLQAGTDPADADDPTAAMRALTRLDLDEESLLKRLDELKWLEKEAKNRATIRGRSLVRLTRLGLLPLSGGFEALLSHARNLERLRHAILRDMEIEHESVRQQLLVRQRLGTLTAQRSRFAGQNSSLLAAEAALQASRDREAAFQRAFGKQSDHTTVYGAPVAGDVVSEPLQAFASLKGRLPFPISGRSEIVAASRDRGSRKGLEMTSRLGAPVLAVYSGRVAFADTYSDYGRTVIIDHGDGYFTVSANLGQVEVRVGEQVVAGARIGTVGAADRGALIYFELRQNGVDLSVSSWFGI